MPLAPATRLGPYEIVAAIGAGGMGEVYRARDARLGRDVAVKVLPAAFSGDPDRLRRFEQEARAAGMLNHPNILAIYDIGTHDGAPYVVSELLEGETLRDRLEEGALAARKAVDYALQTAHGLAAAHQKGIVHRDLKPENLFLTKDGRLKILDFGLAKLTQPAAASEEKTSAPTVAVGTEPGVVMGTVGYMSPEQVRGHAVDHRSDLFSFGAILYEMLTGHRAFRGQSPADTMSAILKEEPAPDPKVTTGLDRVVRHCLEKRPDERFESARDLAFALEASFAYADQSRTMTAVAPARARRRVAISVLAVAAVIASLAGVFFAGRRVARTDLPAFQPLTYRRGRIGAARFAPDGRTIVYSAAWDGNPPEVFSTRPESPESRSFNLPQTGLLAISASGEMAVSAKTQSGGLLFYIGTLARVPMAGGAPRDVITNVTGADWSPEGDRLAIIHLAAGRRRIEFPPGKVLYEAPSLNWLGDVRVSPKGDRVAFVTHPIPGDQRGTIMVADLSGNAKTLGGEWIGGIQGLAWSPNGDEIWFAGGDKMVHFGLYAVNLSGKSRVLWRGGGMLTLQDISRQGLVLITKDLMRTELLGLAPGEQKERQLTWLDGGFSNDLSADGRTMVFTEASLGGGDNGGVYLRKMDGSAPIRLGDGFGSSLSPDGKWVVANSRDSPPRLFLLPAGAGETKSLATGALRFTEVSRWFPDSKRLLLVGTEGSRGGRCYVLDIESGKLRPVTPEGATGTVLSPDGKFVLAGGRDRKLFPIEGGEPVPVVGLEPPMTPLGWTSDPRWVYARVGGIPLRVFRVELQTGQKQLWKEVMPSDLAGAVSIQHVRISPDGQAYVYTYARLLSELLLVEGLR